MGSNPDYLLKVMNWFQLVYWPFRKINMHGALDFCPEQPERNFMYQSYRVAMILLSNLYTVLKGNT